MAGGKTILMVTHDSELAQRVPRVVTIAAASYTHLRAHETVLDIVCRLLLEKKHLYIQYI